MQNPYIVMLRGVATKSFITNAVGDALGDALGEESQTQDDANIDRLLQETRLREIATRFKTCFEAHFHTKLTLETWKQLDWRILTKSPDFQWLNRWQALLISRISGDLYFKRSIDRIIQEERGFANCALKRFLISKGFSNDKAQAFCDVSEMQEPIDLGRYPEDELNEDLENELTILTEDDKNVIRTLVQEMRNRRSDHDHE
jgi:hypothetical protein